MTEVTLYKEEGGRLAGIQCNGHCNSKYINGGADIVCTSVSVCMEMLEMGLRSSIPAEIAPTVKIEENAFAGYKKIMWSEATGTAALGAACASMLKSISAVYPDNVSVKEFQLKKGAKSNDKEA